MKENPYLDDGYMNSPASTPDTSISDEKLLFRSLRDKSSYRNKWIDIRNVPIAIITISVFQLFCHAYFTPTLNKCLRFEPIKRWEVWRFATYMLVHDDWSHLTLNVIIQCIFAAFLERKQGHLRVLIIYLAGGITGVLGATCVHPNLVIGSSAGGYSLLLSNAADLILNYEIITYKLYRSASIATLVLFDIIFDVVHVSSKKEPQVSWQAHLVGAVTGLLLGLVIFQCDTTRHATLRKSFFWLGCILYCVLLVTFIIVAVQIGKCTPPEIIRVHYIYMC
ncbi:protein rhomboid [Sitophilus oryzae]|uniref:Protein rhomboid n=1 Tax=Sitophilus oryzae TaxID=7048 RepID=A0A6J2XV82_SITOR|nr:protein rhomboid [Sitophilus oryzae]XP_030755433.1 protein rhomboid [Sitophilus oryzae]